MLNDKELRLKVLSMLYQNDKAGKSPPGTINDLNGLTLDEYHWASLWLIKHNLAEGHISKGGGYQAWANHVTGHGMDVVENFIDKSLEQIDETKVSIAVKSSTYVEKLLELAIIWSKNPDLYQQAWELLSSIING